MLRRHAPESGVGKGGGGVSQIEIGAAIAFAFEGENGVGAGVHTAGDALGEMYAEKRELGVGHRVDEGADQMFFGRNQVVVLTAKGHDLDSRFLIRHAADAIALEAGTVDEVAGT